VVGSRDRVVFLPCEEVKSNIPFRGPAMASKDPSILGSCQLSSTNLRMELWSVRVWSTKLRLAKGETTSRGSRGRRRHAVPSR